MDACTSNVSRIIGHLTGAFGLFGNALLICLIMASKTPAEMRLFNGVLLYRALAEASEVLVMWILQPVRTCGPDRFFGNFGVALFWCGLLCGVMWA